jgi:hypothetical protein
VLGAAAWSSPAWRTACDDVARDGAPLAAAMSKASTLRRALPRMLGRQRPFRRFKHVGDEHSLFEMIGKFRLVLLRRGQTYLEEQIQFLAVPEGKEEGLV